MPTAVDIDMTQATHYFELLYRATFGKAKPGEFLLELSNRHDERITATAASKADQEFPPRLVFDLAAPWKGFVTSCPEHYCSRTQPALYESDFDRFRGMSGAAECQRHGGRGANEAYRELAKRFKALIQQMVTSDEGYDDTDRQLVSLWAKKAGLETRYADEVQALWELRDRLDDVIERIKLDLPNQAKALLKMASEAEEQLEKLKQVRSFELRQLDPREA